MTRRRTTALPESAALPHATPPTTREAGDGQVEQSTRAAQHDAARADVGVEERHRRASQMVATFARYETLEATISRALLEIPHRCLDSFEDRQVVIAHLVAAISHNPDARFLRELLGPEPADRMTRMHAHGALLQRATEAAWRLAGGTGT